jgi:cytochrome c oxidase cbb3-type subunit I/II
MWLPILLLACGQEPVADPTPVPVQQAMAEALPDDLSQGRLAFRTHCSKCHGRDAAGDGPAASALSSTPGDLAITTRDPDKLSRTMRKGVTGDPMKSFESELEDRELRAITAWLASLGPPPPTSNVE